MDDGVPEMMAVAGLRAKLDDTFMYELLVHLALNAPGFSGSLLLEQLYLRQESLPSPGSPTDSATRALREIGLKIWRQKIEMAEKAIRTADALRKKT